MNKISIFLFMTLRHERNKFILVEDKEYSYRDFIYQVHKEFSNAKTEAGSSIVLQDDHPFYLLASTVANMILGKRVTISQGKKNKSIEQKNRAVCLPNLEAADIVTELYNADNSISSELVFLTSASSSIQSKGVVSSVDNIVFSTLSISSVLKYQESDVVGVCNPLTFDYSFYQMFLAIMSGCTIYYIDFQKYSYKVFDKFALRNVSIWVSIPSILTIYVQLLRHNRTKFKPERITSTGEFLSQQLQNQLFISLPQVKLNCMYGITECKRVSISEPVNCAISHSGCAIPGTRVYVYENGELLDSGTGECVVVGDNVTKGYTIDETDSSCRFTREGGENVLFTGDRIELSDNGNIRFLARMDSMLKRNGIRFYPCAMEAAVCEQFELDYVKLEYDNNRVLTLFVYSREKNWMSAEKKVHVCNFIKSHYPNHMIPESVVSLLSMNRNVNYKYVLDSDLATKSV